MDYSVVLDLSCPRCARPVRVEFEDWQPEAPEYVQTGYTCPWCGEWEKIEASGRAVKVTKRSVH
jgi:hypothetical protein